LLIGRDRVEEEQEGKKRAEYGNYIIKELSKRLTQQIRLGLESPLLKIAVNFTFLFQIM
jgi:hypothetical protein